MIVSLRLLAMENFISLFLRISYHLKYFETINETTPKIYNFILEFYNTSDGGKRLAGGLAPMLNSFTLCIFIFYTNFH
jgi:hypothetical protein